jgi:VWFA-related protein
MRIPGTVLVFVFLTAVALIASAQEEVNVTTIHVWIKATGKSGESVSNLKQEDFEIFEDDQKVEPTCFEELTLPENAPATPASASPAGTENIPTKKVVLFLDLYNTSMPEYKFIKPKMQDFLRGFEGKNVDVMLAGVLANRSMGVFAQFSRDIGKLNELLDKAQPNALRDSAIENNEREIRKALYSGERFNPDGTRRSAADLLSEAYKLASEYTRQDMEITRFSLGAVQNFGGYLGKIGGQERLVVVFVSGGFSYDPGRRYYDIVDTAAEDLREQIDSPALAIYKKGQDFEFQRALQKSVGMMNKLNVTLYTINTRGLIVTDPEGIKSNVPRIAKDQQALMEYGETLSQIAEETGGISFNNSQNFKLGFNNVFQDLSHQYLVCYNAPAHAKKNEYHKIKVTVKDPSVKIRYRRGYFE